MSPIDYSIVICTYNPDERILKRCLEAVYLLDRMGIVTEVILVDNNSRLPVRDLDYVKAYTDKIPGMKTMLVKEQGVQFARMAAIEAALGKYIVYFDYDNEPQQDYLQQLTQLNAQYEQVVAWGPGNVWVDFIDGVDPAIENIARGSFQERHDAGIAFANNPEWQSCYPFGTGLCTNAALLKTYVAYAREGKFTLPGRTGNKLSSGEDTQMVLLCIKKGFAAGVAPGLKLAHIIPGSRANVQYIKKLIYGTYVCYETSRLQVFPDLTEEIQRKLIPRGKFVVQSVKKYFKARRRKDPFRTFDLVQFVAIHTGVYRALNKSVPLIVSRITRSLEVE